MNYYNRHINDYRGATAHLSWDEDAAYNRLLDIYYASEKPLPADIGQVCRLARAAKPAHKAAVEVVLSEFFVLEPDGWHQQRCDEELIVAGERARRARENGTRGGRPPKPDGNPEITQPVPSGPPGGNPSGSYARASHSPFPIPQEERDDATASSATHEASDERCHANGLERPAEPVRQASRAPGSRGTRLPLDWQPDEQDCEFAGSLGFAPGRIEEIAAEFRDYWIGVTGKDGSKTAVGWHGTWRNRCRALAERGAGLAGQGRRGTGSQPVSIAEAARDVARAIDERGV